MNLDERARTAKLENENDILKDEIAVLKAEKWHSDIEQYKALPIDHTQVSIWKFYRDTMRAIKATLEGAPQDTHRHDIASEVLDEYNEFMKSKRASPPDSVLDGTSSPTCCLQHDWKLHDWKKRLIPNINVQGSWIIGEIILVFGLLSMEVYELW